MTSVPAGLLVVNVAGAKADEVAAIVSFAVRGERLPAFLCQYWFKAVPFVVIVPEHARFPVAPSTVHPVAPDPPAIAIVAAVPAPGPILNVEALPPKVRLVLEAKAVKVAPESSEVVKVGEVLITTFPDPVMAFETRFLLPSVKTA